MVINYSFVCFVIYLISIFKINVAQSLNSEDSTNDSTYPLLIDYIQDFYDISPHEYKKSNKKSDIPQETPIQTFEDSTTDDTKYMMKYPAVEPSSSFGFIKSHNISTSCSLDDDEFKNMNNRVNRLGSFSDSGSPDLKELIEMNKSSRGVLLVDFFATWCQPCTRMNETLEVIKSHYKDDKLTIHKINVDENNKYLREYDISALPSVLLFVKGELYKKIVGLVDVKSLMRDIDNSLDTVN